MEITKELMGVDSEVVEEKAFLDVTSQPQGMEKTYKFKFTLKDCKEYELDKEHILERGYILSNVKAQMVSCDNKLLESDVVRRDFLDMAIIYRISLKDDKDGCISYIIKNSILDVVGLTEQDLFDVVSKDMNFDAIPLADMIFNLSGEDIGVETPELFVVTSKNMLYGAGVLCSDYLRSLRDKIEGDLIILPSSKHEVIVIKDNEACIPSILGEMVRDINVRLVSEDDKLTDSVYRFDGNKLSKIA